MKSIPVFLLLGVIAGTATAADAGMSGPVMGFVYGTETRDVRAVLGVPGAAYVGPAILSELDNASVAPGASVALVVREGELALVRGLKTASPEVRPLEGGVAEPSLFAWSADGATAAVYSRTAASAQMIRDGKVEASFDLVGLADVEALAVEGSNLLVAAAGGVYLLLPGEEPKLLTSCDKTVELLISGTDLYVVSPDRILRVQSYAEGAAVMTFADGFTAVAGAQFSPDRRSLIVADGGSRVLSIFEVDTRVVTGSVELDFTPETVGRMGSESAFLLSAGAPGVQPMYVLDGAQAPRVFFVPVGRDE